MMNAGIVILRVKLGYQKLMFLCLTCLQTVPRVNSRWTNEELLLAVQGMLRSVALPYAVALSCRDTESNPRWEHLTAHISGSVVTCNWLLCRLQSHATLSLP